MAGTFSRIKTWIAEILTYSDLNAEFDNILGNMDPDGIDDASANATAMRSTVDPYPASAVSLPTDLRGEFRRIRYILKQLSGETYWYIDPSLVIRGVLTTQGDILYASSANTPARLAKGSARKVLQMNSGATAPEWAASPQSILTAQADLLYASAANTLARLAKGTARKILQMNAGATAPEWVASPQSVLTAQADLLYASAANTLARLAKGAAGKTLVMNSGATAPEWADRAKIKTGTYTGNGSTSQAITGVGFQPTYVGIWEIASTSGNKIEATNGMVSASKTFSHYGAASGSYHSHQSDRIIAMGADGFTVDDAGSDSDPNKASRTYYYLALG